MRSILVIVWLAVPAILFAQNPGEVEEDTTAQDEAVHDSGGFARLSFKNRPSLRLGEIAEIDFKTKWHLDFRKFSPDIWNPPGVVTALPQDPQTFQLTRGRFGFKGHVTKYFDYEVEREMRKTFNDVNEWHPWKDNYVDFNALSWLHVKVGKFKVPFGLEELGAEDRLDYAHKSQVTDTLSPARERGVMLHSRFLRRARLEYEVGVFRYDGENSDIHGQPTAGRTYAARLTGQPLRLFSGLPRSIRHLYVGGAATRGRMFEGRNGIKGETVSGFTYFEHMYVRGYRTRVGAELAWAEGPFSVKGEYIHVSEERINQGIHGEDLPGKLTRGWYVTAGWTALGEMKARGTAPKTPFLRGHSIGAVELSARYDVLSFYSDPGPGLPSRSPRAPTILPNGERTWTFGPTWYLNRFLKIQLNAEREKLTDIERKAVLGITTFWTGVLRVQLAM